jgi:hypothetical protein
LAVLAVVLMFGGLVLALGRHTTAVSLSARRILRPGAFGLFRPRLLPQIIVGPRSVVSSSHGVAVLAALMLLVGVIALGIAVFSWAPWTRQQSR